MRLLLGFCLFVSWASAQVVEHRDIAYREVPGAKPGSLLLDVYTNASLRNAPVVIYVHGGGWREGDKRSVGVKPQAFTGKGYVFLSVNYRMRPDVPITEMFSDIAHAVAWAKKSVTRYGGDPGRIYLMGHSSGAHLVAVVGTNETFLKGAGVGLHDLRGVISLDTGPYDVEKQMKLAAAEGKSDTGRFVFGDDPAVKVAGSPMRHIAKGKGIPAFLVVSSDNRADVSLQAQPFVAALQAAGVKATFFQAKGKDHGGVNADVGKPGDALTDVVFRFLEEK